MAAVAGGRPCPLANPHLGSGRLSRRNRMSGTGRIQLDTILQMVAILAGSVLAGAEG